MHSFLARKVNVWGGKSLPPLTCGLPSFYRSKKHSDNGTKIENIMEVESDNAR